MTFWQTLINSRKANFFLPFILPALVLIATCFTALNAGYLLQGDTGKVHFDAVELAQGCWGYFVRPVPTFILAAFYKLGGVNPALEINILAILAAGTAYCVYWLAKKLTGNLWVGLLAGAWLLSLLGFVYYSRTHLGYPLFWFALMMALDANDLPFWVGVTASLAFHSHAAFGLPVTVWLLTSIIPDLLGRNWTRLFKMGAGFLLVFALIEGVWYLHTGIALEFITGVINEIRWASLPDLSARWYSPLVLLANDNGALPVLVTAISLGYIGLMRREKPVFNFGTRLFILLAGLLLFFITRAGFAHSLTKARFLLVLYLPAVILASVVVYHLIQLVSTPRYRSLISLGTGIAAAGLMLWNLALAHQVSTSGYDAVQTAFKQAAQNGQPVQYVGYDYTGLFFARQSGVETLVTVLSPDVIPDDTQAMLIVDVPYNNTDSVAVAASLPGRDRYNITQVYGHLVTPETPLVLAAQNRSLIEIWTPKVRAGTFSPEAVNYTHYYSGQGCYVPKPYEGGTGYWYDVILRKIGERWASLLR